MLPLLVSLATYTGSQQCFTEEQVVDLTGVFYESVDSIYFGPAATYATFVEIYTDTGLESLSSREFFSNPGVIGNGVKSIRIRSLGDDIQFCIFSEQNFQGKKLCKDDSELSLGDLGALAETMDSIFVPKNEYEMQFYSADKLKHTQDETQAYIDGRGINHIVMIEA